jgi:hypothetical protein
MIISFKEARQHFVSFEPLPDAGFYFTLFGDPSVA